MLPDELAGFAALNPTYDMPLFVVIFGGVLAGLVIGFIWEWIREAGERSAAARQKRELASLRAEVARLRKSRPAQSRRGARGARRGRLSAPVSRDIRVKICGLTAACDVAAAVEAGAAYVGFVFFEKSPRHLDLEAARALARDVPAGVTRVALTVDAGDAALDALCATVPLDMLQLHGAESPARVRAVRARYGLPVMKALGVAEAADLAAIDSYAEAADQLLIDAKPPPGAGVRAATRRRSTGRWSRIATGPCPGCWRAGSSPATWPRPCGAAARGSSTSPRASRWRRGARIRGASAPSSRPRARRPDARAAQQMQRFPALSDILSGVSG